VHIYWSRVERSSVNYSGAERSYKNFMPSGAERSSKFLVRTGAERSSEIFVRTGAERSSKIFVPTGAELLSFRKNWSGAELRPNLHYWMVAISIFSKILQTLQKIILKLYIHRYIYENA